MTSQYQQYKMQQAAGASGGSRASFKDSMSQGLTKQPSQAPAPSRASYAASIKGQLGLNSSQAAAAQKPTPTATSYGAPKVIGTSVQSTSGSTGMKSYGNGPQVLNSSKPTTSGSTSTGMKSYGGGPQVIGQNQPNQGSSGNNPYSSHQNKYDPKGATQGSQIADEVSTRSYANTAYSNSKVDNSYSGMTNTQGSGWNASPNSKFAGSSSKVPSQNAQYKDHGEDTSETDDNNYQKSAVHKDSSNTYATGMNRTGVSTSSSKQAVYSKIGQPGQSQYQNREESGQVSFGDDSDQNDKMMKNSYNNQQKTGNSSYYGNNLNNSSYKQPNPYGQNQQQQQNQQQSATGNKFNYNNDPIESVSDSSGDGVLTSMQQKRNQQLQQQNNPQQFSSGFNPDLMVSDDDEQILKKSTYGNNSQYSRSGAPTTVDPKALQSKFVGSNAGKSMTSSYSNASYPNTVSQSSSSKFVSPNTLGDSKKKVSFSNEQQYTTDKFGRKVPIQIQDMDAIREESDSDTLNSRDNYLDNTQNKSGYGRTGTSGVGTRPTSNSGNAANDFLNNTYQRTGLAGASSSIQKSQMSSSKGGQQNVQQGYNPSNMYNVNPSNPTADPFEANDDFAKQKKRRPGQQDTDSSAYQFQESDDREHKGESSHKDTFRMDTDGSSARFRQSSDHQREQRRQEKERDSRLREGPQPRKSQLDSGRWGDNKEKDKSGIYSDGSFGKSKQMNLNMRETSKSKFGDGYDSRGRAPKLDDFGRSRKNDLSRLSSDDLDSGRYQNKQTVDEREQEDRRRKRKEKERRLLKEKDQKRKYERSSEDNYSSASDDAEYLQQKDKYGNPMYNLKGQPIMVKSSKKDDKGLSLKKKKDSEAPDSHSDDDLRYQSKSKSQWNEYNTKNPQFDGAKTNQAKDQYGNTIYAEGTQFERQQYPNKTPYNVYKSPARNEMNDYEQKQNDKYGRNQEYLDDAATAYTTPNKRFQYNQYAQDEYNQKLKQEGDMERMYIEQQQHFNTVKKKSGKWDLEMENEYNKDFGRTAYPAKSKDQVMSAYYDKYLPKKPGDRDAATTTSEEEQQQDKDHYLAKFARKDEEAEKVREVERQQLRDQIKKDRELKNFKKISKVIQYAAFICPGPMKNIAKPEDHEDSKSKSPDGRNPEPMKAFKNHAEEKEFEQKLERQYRDEGMDYSKILKRIDEAKQTKYDAATAENKKFAKQMGYEEQLDIVRDEMNVNKKSTGLDSRKSDCSFDNHALDYQIFIKQMDNYRTKQHDVLFFPSNHSHGNKTFTRQKFLENVRETMVSCDDKWFTQDGGSPVILFYFTGVGGRDKRTRDAKDAYLAFSDGRISYKELFMHLVEMCAELRHVSKNMNTIFLKIFIDACYSGNAADYLNSNDLTRQDFTKRCQRALKNTWVGLYVYTSCQGDENSSNFGQNGGGKFSSDQFSNFKEEQVEWDYWYWKKYGRKEFANTYNAGVSQVQNPAYGSKNLFF